jgi:hypothetical protein
VLFDLSSYAYKAWSALRARLVQSKSKLCPKVLFRSVFLSKNRFPCFGIGSRQKRAGLIILALSFGGFGQALAQTSLDQMARRQFIHSANERCGWVDGPAQLALNAGLLQNRNAALNAGVSPIVVYAVLDKAREVSLRADCESPELLAEADLLKGAYRGFVAQNRLMLKGVRAQWQADRTEAQLRKWRLVQYQHIGEVSLGLGLFGTQDRYSFSVMAQFKEGMRPYSARLVMRNTYLRSIGLIDQTPLSISAYKPKTLGSQDLSFVALNRHEVQSALVDGPRVNIAGFTVGGRYEGHQKKKPTVRFDFPMSLTTAIARLDPREDIVVVFEFSDGPQYVRFEAGDFVTGLVFTTLPTPYGAGF